MNLDYFLKIVNELNNIYSSKNNDEEIICSANVKGTIYEGVYTLDSFDGKEILILNKNYKYSETSDLLDEKKSFINISKIDSFTYKVHRHAECWK